MVTITLPAELEQAVADEAARTGTTTERLTLDVLQQRFLAASPSENVPDTQAAVTSRAAASMLPMDLSEAEATSLQDALSSGAARPKIKIAPLPEYQS
jgi:hypothetical protein